MSPVETLHRYAVEKIEGIFECVANPSPLPTMFFAISEATGSNPPLLHTLVVSQYPNKRDFYHKIMMAYFMIHHIRTYAYASEAWVSVSTTRDVDVVRGRIHMKPGLAPPSERLDRTEVVVIGAVDKQEMKISSRLIERPAGAKVKLGGEFGLGIGAKGEPFLERAGLMALVHDEARDGPVHCEFEQMLKLILTKMEAKFFDHVKVVPWGTMANN